MLTINKCGLCPVSVVTTRCLLDVVNWVDLSVFPVPMVGILWSVGLRAFIGSLECVCVENAVALWSYLTPVTLLFLF